MKKVFLFLLIAVLSACTSAGPFVTSISADGQGGLIIEKCNVDMNGFWGTVSNNNCTSTQIKVK